MEGGVGRGRGEGGEREGREGEGGEREGRARGEGGRGRGEEGRARGEGGEREARGRSETESGLFVNAKRELYPLPRRVLRHTRRRIDKGEGEMRVRRGTDESERRGASVDGIQ